MIYRNLITGYNLLFRTLPIFIYYITIQAIQILINGVPNNEDNSYLLSNSMHNLNYLTLQVYYCLYYLYYKNTC